MAQTFYSFVGAPQDIGNKPKIDERGVFNVHSDLLYRLYAVSTGVQVFVGTDAEQMYSSPVARGSG